MGEGKTEREESVEGDRESGGWDVLRSQLAGYWIPL
jgi:hypothetical protein